MVKYKCRRCGYQVNHKHNYIKHLSRKKPCKVSLEDVEIETLIEQIIGNNHKTTTDYCKTTADYCKTTADYCKTTADYCENTNLDEISINSSKDSVEIESDRKNNLICQYCNKTFTRKENLENHLKKSCKMLKDFNNIYTYDEKTFGKSIYKDSNKAGDIYIIQTDYINEDHYKIGITTNIKKRMGNYRCGNTYEPRLHYYIACTDIKLIDNKIKIDLEKCRVKREIFKGDVVDIKNKIVEVIKKECKVDEVHVHEPGIKIGDLSECRYCNKCFYNKNDLFDHLNICKNYREYLSKKKEGKYKCKYCHNIYSRKDNLQRHLNKCKKKNTSNQNELISLFKEQIAIMKEEHAKEKQELKMEISQLLEKVGSVTNITHQQNNIYINSYGKENIDYISSNYLNKLIKSPFGAVPKLIKYVHFNPNHPENHNVKITNKKLPYASVWEGNKWTVMDKKQVIENIVDKSFSILDEHYEDNCGKNQKYDNFQQKFNKGEKEIVKIINKDTELLMVNNTLNEHTNL